MAYKKSHTLSNGTTVKHFRVQAYRVDYQAREASAIVAAYADDKNPEPVKPIFAKLRLLGDDFDRILGKKALKASNLDVNAQLYLALQDAELQKSGAIVSDSGKDFFTDALEA